MKRDVFCPICKDNLGKHHQNSSTRPLRDHMFYKHKKEYKKIVNLVEKIDSLYEELKEYGVTHWSKFYFHKNVDFENQIDNTLPMSEEKRKELIENILKSQ